MQPTESLPVSKPTFDRRADESTLPARLSIGPRVGRGPVDGTRWPYPNEASTEFPALVAALTIRTGRVERIGYDMDLWQAAAPPTVTDVLPSKALFVR